MKIGIVGLPNTGKSTLFNAFLKRQQALTANYPFATIEPNIGVVDVPDERVDRLAELSHSEKRVYANITFVDIAGIVEGAHKGEGLGNQFLSHIREVDLLLLLLRSFPDETIIREGSKDPVSDFQVILTELILKDLETIASQESKIKGPMTSKTDEDFKHAVEKLQKTLDQNLPAISAPLTEDEEIESRKLQLLTAKPMIRVLNVAEDDMARTPEYPFADTLSTISISAKIESELAILSPDDQTEYLKQLGLTESPLDQLIRTCFTTLGLETYLTTGPKESRAWKFHTGMNAKECAGIIHTDFFDHFIKAEVISYPDYISCGSKNAAKEAGKLRLEGKEYLMKDGDVVEFKVNA